MFRCLTQTFNFPNKFLICNKHYSLRYFSALCSINDGPNTNNSIKSIMHKKINEPIVIQSRGFSLQNIHTFYDSITSSDACKLIKEVFVETHDFTGFSWPVTIIAVSAFQKLLISFPCGVYQQYLVSKLALTKVELDGMIKGLQEKLFAEALKKKWTKAKLHSEFLSEVRRQKKILIIKNNCHPFKSTILFFTQFPFWLLLTMAIRAFATDVLTGQSEYITAAFQFQVGGLFWCPNLSLPDPTFVLPAINFLSLLITTELSFLSRPDEKMTSSKSSLVKKIVLNFLRLFAVLFFFISAASPSGLSLFWASSSLIALAQNLLLMSPKVRRFLKIPKTSFEFDKPYTQVWNKLLERSRKFFFKNN